MICLSFLQTVFSLACYFSSEKLHFSSVPQSWLFWAWKTHQLVRCNLVFYGIINFACSHCDNNQRTAGTVLYSSVSVGTPHRTVPAQIKPCTITSINTQTDDYLTYVKTYWYCTYIGGRGSRPFHEEPDTLISIVSASCFSTWAFLHSSCTAIATGQESSTCWSLTILWRKKQLGHGWYRTLPSPGFAQLQYWSTTIQKCSCIALVRSPLNRQPIAASVRTKHTTKTCTNGASNVVLFINLTHVYISLS